MSILLNAKSVTLLSDLANKKGEIIFFDNVPEIKELINLKPEESVVWMTSHGRPQQLIVMEDGPTSITIISKDLEGGDIWSLVLPQEESDHNSEVHRVYFVNVEHDFTTSYEESSSSSNDDYDEEDERYCYSERIAEMYGVNEEDDE